MKKIESLTADQEKELVEYRTEMLCRGRCTDASDRKSAEEAITFLYGKIEKKKPMFFWFDSPLTGLIAVEIIRKHWPEIKKMLETNLGANLGANLRANLWANLETNLRENLRANLGANLRENLETNLETNLGANLETNLWANLETNLETNLRENLRANLRANLWANLETNLNKCFFAQHSIAWEAFYDFCNKIGVPYAEKDRAILDGWLKISKSTGWWLPFDGICFCFERHNILELNSDGRLHCENGAAMGFKDGYSIYALNGVTMKKEHVLTRAEELDPKMILAETNVEVRRELIRKIGMERFLQVMDHKILDEKKCPELNTEYALLSVKVHDDLEPQAFLKMLNPSIGVWHVEGVPPECKTVMEALHSRKPPKLRAIPVDESGDDWYQQGDVAIWPQDAKSVKSLPSVLT